MKKAFVFLIICNFIILKGNGQNIKLTASNKPLNKVLIELRDMYDAEFSFNDTELAKYKVTVNKNFTDIKDALIFLLNPFPLTFDIIDDVFVIYRKEIEENVYDQKADKKSYHLTGRIVEYTSGEALPFSIVIINGNAIVADQSGKFSFTSCNDSIFVLNISNLGYYIKDTIVQNGYNKKFELIPSVQNLEEIIITDKILETFSQTGTEAGLINLNHKITKFLPGNNDNSVFNLLRLQSGILASGEQTNDLIIWGSYQGQSKVMFDGFTIFGLKNFNDNISAVNPYIVQHMQIHKAGYDASYGDRVGGIIELIGKNGSSIKPSIDLSISYFTISGLIQLPVTSNSSLMIAGRKTYYELYNAEDLPILERLTDSALVDAITDLKPDYDFMDMNIKYSYKSKKGDLFYISMLGGKDDFSYSFDRINNNRVISKTISESNSQIGTSIFYGKAWKKGFKTDFSFAYSSLNTDYSNDLLWQHIFFSALKYETNRSTINTTEEYMARVKASMPLNEHNHLETGLSYIKNSSFIREDSFETSIFNQSIIGEHINLFVQDRIIFNKVMFKLGGRLNYLPYINEFYLEPRASMSFELLKNFNFNAAWGIYNQFITKSSVLDELGNYRYIWTVTDNIEIPVLDATHYVSGISYHYKGFSLNLEGYYRKTNNLSRFLNRIGRQYDDVYYGEAKSIGADIYLKQNIKGHTTWISYTLSKSTELFDYYLLPEYRLAPHDQRHELKVAGLLNFDPFYFSANYVYGSGFPVVVGIINYPIIETNPYSRLDAAFIYKFSRKKFLGEIGISILNVLNKDNIKISNFERVPASQTTSINIYTESMPFTPTLYLKIGF